MVEGTAVSPDGKKALTLFAVVQGSILDDYLALNLAEPGALYSEGKTVASFSRATELRAFWTPTGQPVLVARNLTGTIFSYGKSSRLIVCQDGQSCPELRDNSPHLTMAGYPKD